MAKSTEAKALSPHELYITECVAQAIGATWVPHDDNSQPAMYDVTLTHADGTPAALEISRAADTPAFSLEKYCSEPKAAPGEYDWTVTVPAGLGLTPKILGKFLPVLIKMCEAAGVETPDALPVVENWFPGAGGPNEAGWYVAMRSRGLVMHRFMRSPDPQITFSLVSGGNIDRGLRNLDAWMCGQVTEAWFASNVEKLVLSGLDELHLAVSLHDVAVPEDLLVSFMKTTGIDSSSVLDAGPLTDLWLFAPFAPVFLRWTKSEGWTLLDRP